METAIQMKTLSSMIEYLPERRKLIKRVVVDEKDNLLNRMGIVWALYKANDGTGKIPQAMKRACNPRLDEWVCIEQCKIVA